MTTWTRQKQYVLWFNTMLNKVTALYEATKRSRSQIVWFMNVVMNEFQLEVKHNKHF